AQPGGAPGPGAPHGDGCPAPEADCGEGGHFWAGAEYLLWWVRPRLLPAVVATSPAGTPAAVAGPPGAPTTGVLFGDQTVFGGGRSGARLSLGYQCDGEHLWETWGISGRFFALEGASRQFAASSTGDPILAIPRIDAAGAPAATLLAFPGLASGAV